ncbi:type II toxin-antitoxin system VapC family toxin [Lacisediminihabitans profunda]|uniref:Ribonuclease VapC n=1 Tax=Lacisediminihabitans profunda TaxID=2594790 RepID=A0A5C8UPG8_9MICO|nr:type II toxin-antitoxin system VapC family toxin [Lacisediminihabitans profunda]TXN29417.1 type II toxin-antitoxin system VapC family toxin [Lacisediminihabitans profunda]
MARFYVDSSALIKRAVEEVESDALEEELSFGVERGHVLIASSLAWVEVTRALRSRLGFENADDIRLLADVALSGISEGVMDGAVVALARRLSPVTLRSVDAIHLATAVLLDADVVIAYDQRLIEGARELGLRTRSPR